MPARLRQLSDGRLRRSVLVEGFLGSGERRALDAGASPALRVEIEGFLMLVRLSDPPIGAVIARDRCYEPHLSAQRALEGMRESLRTRRPTALVEFSPDLIRVSSGSGRLPTSWRLSAQRTGSTSSHAEAAIPC